MKKGIILIAGLGLLLVAQPAHSESAGQPTDNRGRYEGGAGSENAVWVLDTHTGKVRKCTQEFSDQTPSCSTFSK